MIGKSRTNSVGELRTTDGYGRVERNDTIKSAGDAREYENGVLGE